MLLRPVILRSTHPSDLASFFRFQLDPVAAHMAAFTPSVPLDETAYVAKYTRFLDDPTIHMCTIVVAGTIVGSVAKFEREGQAELTYWLDRPYWGQGIASSALRTFLQLEPTRPLVARVAGDNVGSQQVLGTNGFIQIGTARGFAAARQAEIEELIYQLTE
jgi:ribosomal-protein-alanine N-acetyltransferase